MNYVERLLTERPTHTKGGTPVEIIEHHGTAWVRTNTGNSRNGGPSYYAPCDFPQLFGWPRTGRNKPHTPLTITFKGRRYLRLPRVTV